MINQTVGMQSEGNLKYIKQIILFCNVNMDRVTYTTVNSLLFWKERKKTLCNFCMCIEICPAGFFFFFFFFLRTSLG